MKKIRKCTLLLLAGVLFCTQPAAAETLSEQPLLEEGTGAEKAEAEGSGTGQPDGGTVSAAAQTGAQSAASAAETAASSGAAVEKPAVSSEAAVLYDATAKQVLFAKNQDQAMYPASITKIMTVLLAAEKLGLKDTVNFSASATQNLEAGYTNVQMTVGDSMSVKDALYAVMLKSACEVSNALAEQVSGTQTAFAALMNQRAAELGCRNTNFKNASGLNDSGHVTTAYDMALIAAAAFSNQTVRTVCSAKSYTLPASKKRGSLSLSNSNKMLYSSNAEYFEGIVGGKTGYTSKAGNTLVEVADVSGHELVAVVMKSSGKHYSDARKLLVYGKELLAASSSASGTASEAGVWEETQAGRKYRFSSGEYAAAGWTSVGGEMYYFGADGIAAEGWRQFTNGAWYYFEEGSGRMIHGKWVSADGTHYYYLGSDGAMAVNTWIDGKYRVDENGIYVEKAG